MCPLSHFIFNDDFSSNLTKVMTDLNKNCLIWIYSTIFIILVSPYMRAPREMCAIPVRAHASVSSDKYIAIYKYIVKQNYVGCYRPNLLGKKYFFCFEG